MCQTNKRAQLSIATAIPIVPMALPAADTQQVPGGVAGTLLAGVVEMATTVVLPASTVTTLTCTV